MGKIMLTGDRPTGRLHVGHYVGSLKSQSRAAEYRRFDEMFVMIADAQALTDNADNPEKVRQNIIEVAAGLSGMRTGSPKVYTVYPVTDSTAV